MGPLAALAALEAWVLAPCSQAALQPVVVAAVVLLLFRFFLVAGQWLVQRSPWWTPHCLKCLVPLPLHPLAIATVGHQLPQGQRDWFSPRPLEVPKVFSLSNRS